MSGTAWPVSMRWYWTSTSSFAQSFDVGVDLLDRAARIVDAGADKQRCADLRRRS